MALDTLILSKSAPEDFAPVTFWMQARVTGKSRPARNISEAVFNRLMAVCERKGTRRWAGGDVGEWIAEFTFARNLRVIPVLPPEPTFGERMAIAHGYRVVRFQGSQTDQLKLLVEGKKFAVA